MNRREKNHRNFVINSSLAKFTRRGNTASSICTWRRFYDSRRFYDFLFGFATTARNNCKHSWIKSISLPKKPVQFLWIFNLEFGACLPTLYAHVFRQPTHVVQRERLIGECGSAHRWHRTPVLLMYDCDSNWTEMSIDAEQKPINSQWPTRNSHLISVNRNQSKPIKTTCKSNMIHILTITFTMIFILYDRESPSEKRRWLMTINHRRRRGKKDHLTGERE
jgi:hypothetical protein